MKTMLNISKMLHNSAETILTFCESADKTLQEKHGLTEEEAKQVLHGFVGLAEVQARKASEMIEKMLADDKEA